MSAKSLVNKMILVFAWSRRVVHHYWMHTDGDEAGDVSIENVQQVISRLTGLPIEKLLVDFEGTTLRGNIERYDDRAVIHVRAGLSPNWQRFTVVKEMCHILLDEKEDWSTDVVTTISDLLSFSGLDGDESAPLRSEKLAELMALELIYPLEFRDEDRAFLDAGGKVSDLADKRKVPPLWIERALAPGYIELCKDAWTLLKEIPSEKEPLPLLPIKG